MLLTAAIQILGQVFLLFPALKAWCEEQGVAEFGVYGRK